MIVMNPPAGPGSADAQRAAASLADDMLSIPGWPQPVADALWLQVRAPGWGAEPAGEEDEDTPFDFAYDASGNARSYAQGPSEDLARILSSAGRGNVVAAATAASRSAEVIEILGRARPEAAAQAVKQYFLGASYALDLLQAHPGDARLTARVTLDAALAQDSSVSSAAEAAELVELAVQGRHVPALAGFLKSGEPLLLEAVSEALATSELEDADELCEAVLAEAGVTPELGTHLISHSKRGVGLTLVHWLCEDEAAASLRAQFEAEIEQKSASTLYSLAGRLNELSAAGAARLGAQGSAVGAALAERARGMVGLRSRWGAGTGQRRRPGAIQERNEARRKLIDQCELMELCGESKDSIARIALAHTVGLSSTELARMLQGVSAELIGDWLGGQHKMHRPEPGEVTEVLAGRSEADRHALARAVYARPDAFEQPWGHEIARTIGLPRGGDLELTWEVRDAIEQFCGDEPGAWEVAISIADDEWLGGAEELGEVAAAAAGTLTPGEVLAARS